MVKVNKILPIIAEHFDNNDQSLGFLNEYENADLRYQVAKENVVGYYLMFNGEKIDLLISGKLSNWPIGLYDQNEILLGKIFELQCPKF